MTFDLTEYIRGDLFVLVPVLYVLGMLFKKSPVKNWLIPFLLCGMGVLLSFAFLVGQGAPFGKTVFTSITQGVLCAACSVFANNVVKQFRQRKSQDEKTEQTEDQDKTE